MNPDFRGIFSVLFLCALSDFGRALSELAESLSACPSTRIGVIYTRGALCDLRAQQDLFQQGFLSNPNALCRKRPLVTFSFFWHQCQPVPRCLLL